METLSCSDSTPVLVAKGFTVLSCREIHAQRLDSMVEWLCRPRAKLNLVWSLTAPFRVEYAHGHVEDRFGLRRNDKPLGTAPCRFRWLLVCRCQQVDDRFPGSAP